MATRRWISTSSGDFTTGANWSGGSAPISNDTIIFDGTGTAALTTNLNQSAVTGITLIITQAHTAAIGSDSAGTATYFQIGASTASIGRSEGGSGNGSPLVLLDFGATSNATKVYNTSGSSTNSKYPPVCFKGSAMTLTVVGGKVGVVVRPAETSSGFTLRVARGEGSEPDVYLGAGVTLTELVMDAGFVQSLSDNTATLVRVSGGEYLYEGTGAHTTLHVDEGTCTYNGTGTITTANIRGLLDFSGDPRAKTVTTANCYRGFTLNVDNGVPGGIVFTNPINFYDGYQSGTLTTPQQVKGTLVAI